MDVRCEKCQTEYELDEARLKPGGVTVKCTNCGHMFKIRKRNASGAAPVAPQPPSPSQPMAARAPQPRADSMFDEAPTAQGEEGPTTVDRQWLIRLENGEQKSCRELATLQQWIVAGVVTRESLISRSGKTWKRLGDIGELAQYFDIGDEARTTRDERRAAPTKPPGRPEDAAKATMLGMGSKAPAAAGGTILPDDEDEGRTTGSFAAPRRPITQPPPPPGAPPRIGPASTPTKTPPMGSNAAAPRRPITTPPPPPPKKPPTEPPPPAVSQELPNLKGAPTTNRSTAAWASDGAEKLGGTAPPPPAAGPSGPFVGKLAAIPDEPAFAGKIRVAPSDEGSFETGKITREDDDDDLLPRRRGSSAGLLILFAVLIIGGAAAFTVWYLVLRDPDKTAARTAPDAATVAETPDAAPVVTPLADAAEQPVVSQLDQARGELASDQEPGLKRAWDALAASDDPAALAVRGNLGTALAQAMLDRAALTTDKAEADKLRKDAKALVLEAATAAQKAHKAAPDDAAANVAMAHVLRLQAKPARDVKRYVDAAKSKGGAWARDAALAEALLHKREGKLADARTAFAAIDTGDGALEKSNDVRARFQLALIALANGKPAEAKPLVDQILTAQPDHSGAKALAAKLATTVATDDPLPPEDPGKGSNVKPPTGGGDPPVTGDYDSLVRRADTLAQSNCTKAMEIYGKALEKKPNGVEALTGQGYCQLDAKNFASAYSRFRTALVISSRYEPALAGLAEAYQQQGRKEDAIAAWRRYLEAYPGARKALAALERLGAGAGDTPPPQGSNTPPPAQGSGSGDTPPPPPPPQPPPQPDGAGSGSG